MLEGRPAHVRVIDSLSPLLAVVVIVDRVVPFGPTTGMGAMESAKSPTPSVNEVEVVKNPSVDVTVTG